MVDPNPSLMVVKSSDLRLGVVVGGPQSQLGVGESQSQLGGDEQPQLGGGGPQSQLEGGGSQHHIQQLEGGSIGR